MNRKTIFLVMLAMLTLTVKVFALPVTYAETYYGNGSGVFIGEGQTRTFNFNLIGIGGNSLGVTENASGFTPGGTITKAEFGFELFSMDLAPDNVVLHASAKDGAGKLLEKTFFLGNVFGQNVKEVKLDLLSLGLGDFLKDGFFSATFKAPRHLLYDNDFELGDVSLFVTTDNAAPVPEPGTMVLLSVGFVGLAVFGKRRMNAA